MKGRGVPGVKRYDKKGERTMKKNLVEMLGLAMLVLFVGYVMAASGAYAAGSETKGSESKGSETKAVEPADSATKDSETKAMKCTVVGKVELRTEKVNEEEVSVPYVKVSEAKGPNEKAMPHMKGKLVKVVGAKAANAEALAGKEVEVTGVLRMEIVADAVAAASTARTDTYGGSSSK